MLEYQCLEPVLLIFVTYRQQLERSIFIFIFSQIFLKVNKELENK